MQVEIPYGMPSKRATLQRISPLHLEALGGWLILGEFGTRAFKRPFTGLLEVILRPTELWIGVELTQSIIYVFLPSHTGYQYDPHSLGYLSGCTELGGPQNGIQKGWGGRADLW